MGRPTKKEKACPECGRPRSRLYRRHLSKYQIPFGWFCSNAKHGFIIWVDDSKTIMRRIPIE